MTEMKTGNDVHFPAPPRPGITNCASFEHFGHVREESRMHCFFVAGAARWSATNELRSAR